MARRQKIVVVGAGPVGSLAALYAARRGHQVEVYDLRPDLRNPGIIPLNFTKSINLAVSERAIHAMRYAHHPGLLDGIMRLTVEMRARMIHGKTANGDLYELSQPYDATGKCSYAVDRGALNAQLLDALDALPNVELFFNHKLTGADFRTRRAWLEDRSRDSNGNGRPREIEIVFDLMIGADGAHSAVRYHLMKFARMDYQQEYIDTLWCEFRIEPSPAGEGKGESGKFRIDPYHLHIWPGRDFMFIAIASDDGSFTCTLFLPSGQFIDLERDPSQLPAFFDAHFPGVTDLIPADALLASFVENPHLPLISLKCRPYHYGSSGIIIGDAAHAMVPFYGQGMNAGMEDVRVLFDVLDKHTRLEEDASSNDPRHPGFSQSSSATDDFDKLEDFNEDEDKADTASRFHRAHALAEYSTIRAPDAHTINELALQNYVEMRSSVLSWRYLLRKRLEEFMSVTFPSLGWRTKYSRVCFTNERYSEVVRNSDDQGRILMRAFYGLAASPIVLGGAVLLYRLRRSI